MPGHVHGSGASGFNTSERWKGPGISESRHTEIHDGLPLGQGAAGELAYAEVTANQGSITAETDITGLTVTFTPAANRILRVTHFCTDFQGDTVNDVFVLSICDGSNTHLQERRVRANTTGTNSGGGVMQLRTTSSGASTTYKVRAVRASGTDIGRHVAAADAPAFILVEDLGPA